MFLSWIDIFSFSPLLHLEGAPPPLSVSAPRTQYYDGKMSDSPFSGPPALLSSDFCLAISFSGFFKEFSIGLWSPFFNKPGLEVWISLVWNVNRLFVRQSLTTASTLLRWKGPSSFFFLPLLKGMGNEDVSSPLFFIFFFKSALDLSSSVTGKGCQFHSMKIVFRENKCFGWMLWSHLLHFSAAERRNRRQFGLASELAPVLYLMDSCSVASKC